MIDLENYQYYSFDIINLVTLVVGGIGQNRWAERKETSIDIQSLLLKLINSAPILENLHFSRGLEVQKRNKQPNEHFILDSSVFSKIKRLTLGHFVIKPSFLTTLSAGNILQELAFFSCKFIGLDVEKQRKQLFPNSIVCKDSSYVRGFPRPK